jgi:hypothetical protein
MNVEEHDGRPMLGHQPEGRAARGGLERGEGGLRQKSRARIPPCLVVVDVQNELGAYVT